MMASLGSVMVSLWFRDGFAWFRGGFVMASLGFVVVS